MNIMRIFLFHCTCHFFIRRIFKSIFVTLEFGRWRQENQKVKVILNYISESRLAWDTQDFA